MNVQALTGHGVWPRPKILSTANKAILNGPCAGYATAARHLSIGMLGIYFGDFSFCFDSEWIRIKFMYCFGEPITIE